MYVLYSPQEFSGSSPKRRRAEEKDEGIGSPDTIEEEKMEELRREILELRQQLDKERSARMQVEDEVKRVVSSPEQTFNELIRTDDKQSLSGGDCGAISVTMEMWQRSVSTGVPA